MFLQECAFTSSLSLHLLWSGAVLHDFGPLHQIKGNLNDAAFSDILNNSVLPSLGKFGEGAVMCLHTQSEVHIKILWKA